MNNIFIINGKGGSGKDTFVKLVKEYTLSPVFNYSTIDIIKKMAYNYGWNGKKTNRNRLLLCKLKEIWTWYNDLPYYYVYSQIKRDREEGVMFDTISWFIHCREPEGIEKIKQYYNNKFEWKVYTMLCKRDSVDKEFGNNADDNVDNYTYDIIIDNNKSIDDLKNTSINFIKTYIGDLKNV